MGKKINIVMLDKCVLVIILLPTMQNSQVVMGNCCCASSATDERVEVKFIETEVESLPPGKLQSKNSPQQAQAVEEVRHLSPESPLDNSVPSEPHRLEHMADREGQSSVM